MPYLNAKQMIVAKATQETRVVVAGRGFGKTEGCIGVSLVQKLKDMPGSKGMLYSTTYKQLLQSTVPALINFWRRCGYWEHLGSSRPGHFVIGKRPPKQWAECDQPPRDYGNIITFWNGFTIVLISLDRADLARGGSYQWMEGDEIALVPKKKLDDILITSIRGSRHKFGKCRGYRQKSLYTSMPRKVTGQYVLDYEKLASKSPDEVFYMEATSYDNVDVLGADTIESWRKSMGPMSFNIEVLNKRYIKAQKGAFYHKFSEIQHCYLPKHLYVRGGPLGTRVAGTADRDIYKAIDASFDFGGWFNCATVYQREGLNECMRSQHHVYDNSSIDELIDKMCIDMGDQALKHVNVYGDPRGHDARAEGITLYERIQRRLHSNGWSCTIVVQPIRTQQQSVRYEYINEILAETNPQLPRLRINDETCKDVIVALNIAEVKPDFSKNKKNESEREYNQAHATHYTDTVDYFFVQKYMMATALSGGSGEWAA